MAAKVTLSQPSQLLAAVPALVGFTPTDSLVVITHCGESRRRLGLVMRADLVEPEWYVQLAERLLASALQHRSTGATLVVVGGGERPRAHESLVDTIADVFEPEGIPVLHAVWVPSVATGVEWRCLDGDERCKGRIADPGSSPLAAATALHGKVTYASRDELAATIRRDGRKALTRRAGLIVKRLSEANAGTQKAKADRTVVPITVKRAEPLPPVGVRRLNAVYAAANILCTRKRLPDKELVDVAIALTDWRVRDAVMVPDDPADMPGLHRLWLYLARALPDPHCADAACLLATSAYIEGDGAMAGIALDRALESAPDHRLAGLLDALLAVGLPPKALLRKLKGSAASARRALTAE
jgi:hypothetical protein